MCLAGIIAPDPEIDIFVGLATYALDVFFSVRHLHAAVWLLYVIFSLSSAWLLYVRLPFFFQVLNAR